MVAFDPLDGSSNIDCNVSTGRPRENMGTVSLIANIEALIIRIGFGGCVYTYIYIHYTYKKEPSKPYSNS